MRAGRDRRAADRTPVVQPEAALAVQLQRAMERKGWSISETARQTSRFLPEGERFGRAHVWHYVRRRVVPRPHHLEALARALEIEPPRFAEPAAPPAPTRRMGQPRPRASAAADPASPRAPSIHVSQMSDGTAFLSLRAVVPWDMAIKVLGLLKNDVGGAAGV
jgi:hypothetical protein